MSNDSSVDFELLKKKGLKQWSQGYRKEAIHNLEQAAQAEPNDVDTLVRLAMMLNHMKRFEEASQLFAKAIHMDPNNPFAFAGRAISLSELSDREQDAVKHAYLCELAEADFARLQELCPNETFSSL